jgi:opacity protein-like surface antigen
MKKLTLILFTVALLMSLTVLAQYSTKPSDDQAKQDNAKAAEQEKQGPKSTSDTKTVTGCLQKGDEPEEFSIIGKDGKNWELRSNTVKLADHVGHTVTVTGPITRESKAEESKEKKEGQMEKASGKEEYGELRVTNLKMVSQTCSK